MRGKKIKRKQEKERYKREKKIKTRKETTEGGKDEIGEVGKMKGIRMKTRMNRHQNKKRKR